MLPGNKSILMNYSAPTRLVLATASLVFAWNVFSALWDDRYSAGAHNRILLWNNERLCTGDGIFIACKNDIALAEAHALATETTELKAAVAECRVPFSTVLWSRRRGITTDSHCYLLDLCWCNRVWTCSHSPESPMGNAGAKQENLLQLFSRLLLFHSISASHPLLTLSSSSSFRHCPFPCSTLGLCKSPFIAWYTALIIECIFMQRVSFGALSSLVTDPWH